MRLRLPVLSADLHEGDGGLLPPAGLLHPLPQRRDGVQQRRPTGGGRPVGRAVVAGQEAALRCLLRWSDSLCQHAEEVTRLTSSQAAVRGSR